LLTLSANIYYRYVGLARQTNTGVTSLSMSAGTGKIKVVSAARAGVPRASTVGDPNYDAAAALGLKSTVRLMSQCTSSVYNVSRLHSGVGTRALHVGFVWL
jgi:hypothetical protein